MHNATVEGFLGGALGDTGPVCALTARQDSPPPHRDGYADCKPGHIHPFFFPFLVVLKHDKTLSQNGLIIYLLITTVRGCLKNGEDDSREWILNPYNN